MSATLLGHESHGWIPCSLLGGGTADYQVNRRQHQEQPLKACFDLVGDRS